MVIALLTDFGDYYPGVMKGVIRKITQDEVIDLTHSIHPQNVFEGAFLLHSAYRYFPAGTIFISVVDPGVGGDRAAIVIKTENYWFVCPDNGIAFPSAVEDGIRKILRIKESVSQFSGAFSSTFHGRDIFAPAGALIREGRMEHFERFKGEPVKLDLFDARVEGGRIVGRVVHIDRFGNAVTNITRNQIEEYSVTGFMYRGHEIPLVEKYEDVERGKPLAIIGSFNTLELSLREDNFSRHFNVDFGNIELGWI
ncbi:SAM-dependent chlorinase/fluorinase [Geoglobus acetivorans]